MIANRPDWCISRQRSWGVPIPALYCTSCHEPALTPAIVERAAAVFDEHGADAWYERDVAEFVPDGLRCASCGSAGFERERDILDVWFDSGSSHAGVLALDPSLAWPADVYLEGTDQYRGWFHSSLLVGVGTRGAAPYRTVVTHGFVVDQDGRKMSKSRGNGVEPQEVIAKSGAEILRLWAAMVDYRDEVRLGPQILDRVIEAYRKIRNTLRILAANLYDFEPHSDALPLEALDDVDRYALARYGEAARRMLRAYDAYDYPAVIHALNALLTVDVSAFYVDVSKDRLYTFGAASRERRAAQTAMYRMADGLTRLLAPILPVTADELWRVLPGRREESVHLALFPSDVEELIDPDVLDRWERLIRLRDVVNVEAERLRQQKVIGTSLEARVSITAAGRTAELLERHRDDLATLFIVSQVAFAAGDAEAVGASGGGMLTGPDGQAAVVVSRAPGTKCPRCWRIVEEVSTEAETDGLCLRCLDAVATVAERSAE
jgi:isoleucyl-tRNA synthetase